MEDVGYMSDEEQMKKCMKTRKGITAMMPTKILKPEDTQYSQQTENILRQRTEAI